jgi:REP element-mobilizing transposase RayT
MIVNRPKRLSTFSYTGYHRYFLTICTYHRRRTFVEPSVVRETLSHVRQSARDFRFALLAYCFMPDHLHLVVAGKADDAELPPFVKDAKQRSGFWFRRQDSQPLWQPGYHDRVLRDGHVTLAVVRYTLENPVRAGLVASPEEYEFSGSDLGTVRDLCEVFRAASELEVPYGRPEQA